MDLQGESLPHNDQDIVSMMLYVKDRYNISGNAYHEMASLCRQMPRHYTLKQRISELNAQWNIYPTPEGTGVQQSPTERLVLCVERMVSVTPLRVCLTMCPHTDTLTSYTHSTCHIVTVVTQMSCGIPGYVSFHSVCVNLSLI